MKRRDFLQLVLSAAAGIALVPVFGTRPAKAFWAAVFAVASLALNYIGSKGDPTASMLSASFKLLEGLHLNITQINQSLQYVVAELYKLRELVTQVKTETIRELLELDYYSTWDTILAKQKSFTLATGEGDPPSLDSHYELIKANFEELGRKRRMVMTFGSQNHFESCVHVCVAQKFELDTLFYLIGLAESIGRNEYTTSDGVVIIDEYLRYFSAALDESNPASIVSLRAAAVERYNDFARRYGYISPTEGEQVVSCEYIDGTTVETYTETYEEMFEGERRFTDFHYEVRDNRFNVYKTTLPVEVDAYGNGLLSTLDGSDRLLPEQIVERQTVDGDRLPGSVPALLPEICRSKDQAFRSLLKDSDLDGLVAQYNDGLHIANEMRSAIFALDAILRAIAVAQANVRCTREVLQGNAACVLAEVEIQ